MQLNLVQRQSSFWIRHENLPDEAERERVELAPRCDERVLVLLPGQILFASDRWLVPGQLLKREESNRECVIKANIMRMRSTSWRFCVRFRILAKCVGRRKQTSVPCPASLDLWY